MNNFVFDNELERKSDKVEEQLLNYCRNGNYKQVVHLFDKYYDSPGFDVNCRDVDGNTPLILAAKQGHGTIIQELLRYVPDISCENRRGETAMHLSPAAIKKILFGSISSVIRYSDRLFCNACWLSNAEVVDRFLSKNQVRMGPHLSNIDGVNCCQLVLKNMNYLEQIANSMKFSYKPAQTLQSLLNHCPPGSHNPLLLHLVAIKNCNNSVECARVLLRKNFEIAERDEFDFTALHHAARSGNVAVLEFLLARMKNQENKLEFIDFPGKNGTTALHLASMEGREEAVRVLLSHGASADVLNSHKYSPIQLAKSARIKNLFLTAAAPSQFNQNKQKLLPELPLVLARASTAFPFSPHARISQLGGKKSAEPQIYRGNYREKSLSNPDINEQFDVSSRVSQLPPVALSSELPASSPENSSSFRQKLATSSTFVGVLESLDEENWRDSGIEGGEENRGNGHDQDGENEFLFRARRTRGNDQDGENEFLFRARSNRGNFSKKQTSKEEDHIETESQSTRNNEIIVKTADQNENSEGPTKKKRTNISKNKISSKPIKNFRKPEPGNRGKTKTNLTTNDKGKGQNANRKGTENFLARNKENKNEANEVNYESDFNTDSSSAREENKEYCAARSEEGREEEEEAESDLNKTLVASLSARMSEEHLQWKKGEQLGKGSYGTVWKGMLENGQYIAVKEILTPENEEQDNIESCITNTREIRREIDILRTIQHKNIVKYIGACDSATCIHIFMEFVSGGSLAYILTKFGGLTEKVIKIYMKQIVTAVAFLHTKLIIHRDLKGANIMVTPKGVIKIVDFGCAKKLENFAPNTGSLTQQSRLQGSVYWLAPEVINGAKHTSKSDIWSIGCTGIEMITTKPPWSDLHPFPAMFAIGSGNKPFNVSLLTTSNGVRISSEICLFIESCLTRDVANRATAIELLTSPFLN